MHIPCLNLVRPYHIYGTIRETVDAGEVNGTTCAVSIKHEYGLLGRLSKAVCSFVDGAGECGGTNLDAFAKDAREALNPFCLKLNGNRVCSGLLDHDAIRRKWEGRLPAMRSKYSGDWVDGQLQAMDKRVRESDGLCLSLCRHFIFAEWFMSNVFDIDFTGDYGTREWTGHAFGEPITLRQECFLENKGDKQALIIDGTANLGCGHTNTGVLRSDHKKEGGQAVVFGQHTVWKGENLSLLPDSIESLYTLSGPGETFRRIMIELKFKDSHEH